ncbi:MAG: hypothetical protein CML23_19680 [Rhizobiaceae bacterium]|nr:hypothetical protein [Rhizobiaceae bacterium]
MPDRESAVTGAFVTSGRASIALLGYDRHAAATHAALEQVGEQFWWTLFVVVVWLLVQLSLVGLYRIPEFLIDDPQFWNLG